MKIEEAINRLYDVIKEQKEEYFKMYQNQIND